MNANDDTRGATVEEATAGDRTTAAAPRQLVRRRQDRVLAGVAGGLGDYFGIDPVIFRLVFVAAAIAGGTGLIAYLAAWLLIPEASGEGDPAPSPRRAPERPQAWIGIALLVVGAAMLFGQVGWWGPDVLWALALIGIGILLFRNDQERRTEGASPPPPPPTTVGEGGGSSSTTDAPGGTVPTSSRTSSRASMWPRARAVPASRRRPARERSMLGWLTVGAALVAMGVSALLSDRGTLDLAGYQILSIGLAIIGLGLILGAWVGRSRSLILVGLLFVPAILGANLVPTPMSSGTGERFFSPRTAEQLRPHYELFAGELTLDLSRLALEGRTHVSAEVGAGRVEVLVPEGIATAAHAAVEIGAVDVFGSRQEGNDLSLTRRLGTGDALELDLSTSLGEIVVAEVPTRAPPR